MANNIMRTQKAFTLTELAIGILIAAIAGAAISLSSLSAKQTAKHEAERVAAYIYRTIQKADRIHKGFNIYTGQDFGTSEYFIAIRWPNADNKSDKSFQASPGCKFVDNFDTIVGSRNENTYLPEEKRFKWGGHITVTDSAGENYYVIFAAVEEGRIRIDENPPK